MRATELPERGANGDPENVGKIPKDNNQIHAYLEKIFFVLCCRLLSQILEELYLRWKEEEHRRKKKILITRFANKLRPLLLFGPTRRETIFFFFFSNNITKIQF